ncbi:transcriptional regulator, marr family [hydrocarbon metagenome]|uniref:Transcriptional regulator, marr family n=1 Tax=hydrocarbon metagenome TaxID=938273 RepID=A0A0W8E5U2_9ZZZZ
MIFALLLIISNKMNTLLDREFKEFDVTTKQWFLSETIKSLFDTPPTMKELASEMGSSHQNIKQVALKLEQKGLLKLEKDKKDARVTRLRLTERSYDFWKKTDPKGSVFRESMFKEMNKKDIATTRALLGKMLLNLTEIENADIEEAENT